MITFISVSRHSIEKSRIKHLSKHSQTFESNETINILSLGTFTLKVEGEILKDHIVNHFISVWHRYPKLHFIIDIRQVHNKGFESKCVDLQSCLWLVVSISHSAHTPAKVTTKQRDRYGCICCICLKIFKGIQISSTPTKHFENNIRQLILPQTFHWLTGVHAPRPSETFFSSMFAFSF